MMRVAICLEGSLTMINAIKSTTFDYYAYITISFSYVYLRGLHLGMPSSSLHVVIAVHLRNLAMSPLRMFIMTVSAISSAL
ncbi:hypothetical protein EB796_013489 [Bugula neritina]|uniref:Uncharacterized protein n=1 Tax=Bugula neritina TaxID=10212 RepID=A0A7J7JQD8_BUGNE|nr:hypothetical protein EB796_013489 [Bugula neritina]